MASNYAKRIASSGLTIYDELPVDSELRIPSEELEKILRDALKGLDTEHLPIRPRSKFVKIKVCEAMGYPVPPAFRRTKPRFIGQNFDVYVQKKRTMAVYNDTVQLDRRYAIATASPLGVIENVHVLSGADLKKLEKKGTLTSKYQAILRHSENGRLSKTDTGVVSAQLTKNVSKVLTGSPIDAPDSESLLSIGEIHRRLRRIEGMVFEYGGASMERVRGELLHNQVAQFLGYSIYHDKGTFPDIPAQLLEVKLQTKQTMDLGFSLPDSNDAVKGLHLSGEEVAPRDIRYAVLSAERTNNNTLTVTKVYVVTGAEFFDHFDLMKGKGVNKKLQIILPKEYFPWLL